MPFRKFLMPEARSPATFGSLPAPKMIRITSRTISQCQKLNVPIPLSPPARGPPTTRAPAAVWPHYDRDSAAKAIFTARSSGRKYEAKGRVKRKIHHRAEIGGAHV